MPRIRVAIVSPFIDKWHGTERLVAEWVSRLPEDYELHVYSQQVADLDLKRMKWHRIPTLPGPHLLNFLWFFVANHLWRFWDSRFCNLKFNIVYTAGTNCLDADVVSVHIVFAEFFRQARSELKLSGHPIRFWPRLLHRLLYYKLIIFLERRIYSDPNTSLIIIANKTAIDLKHFYNREDRLAIVYVGLDHEIFNPEARLANRSQVRAELGLKDDRIALLLVGNDWKKKGIVSLIEAMSRLQTLPVVLLIVGKDDPTPYQPRIQSLGLQDRVKFCAPRSDVQWFYAAADIYVGPSLEDTFALPPFEAMACGLPIITTVTNGTAEVMTEGVDGFIIDDPTDVETLTARIQALAEDPFLRERIGKQAFLTAEKYTYDGNGEQIRGVFADALIRKENTQIRTGVENFGK